MRRVILAIYFWLFAVTAILIFEFARHGVFDTGFILATSGGWFLALLIMVWARGKDTGTGWAVGMMSLMFIPVVLFFLVMGLNKALSLHLSLPILMVIYLALLIAVFLAARRMMGKMMTGPVLPQAEMDEKDVKHIIWSGFIGFGVLSTLLIAALLQPWISYNDLRLWLGVLGTGMLSWFLSLLVFSLVK